MRFQNDDIIQWHCINENTVYWLLPGFVFRHFSWKPKDYKLKTFTECSPSDNPTQTDHWSCVLIVTQPQWRVDIRRGPWDQFPWSWLSSRTHLHLHNGGQSNYHCFPRSGRAPLPPRGNGRGHRGLFVHMRLGCPLSTIGVDTCGKWGDWAAQSIGQ